MHTIEGREGGVDGGRIVRLLQPAENRTRRESNAQWRYYPFIGRNFASLKSVRAPLSGAVKLGQTGID